MTESTPLLGRAEGEQGENEHVVGGRLGTISGCFVPCMLNIVGVIMFEQLGWTVGHLGWGGTMVFFLMAETMCVLTVLSLSAIISNGDMKGGGSYYLISRTTGPELGGAIGVLFYSAFSVGASFYAAGFAQVIAASWMKDVSVFGLGVDGMKVLIASGALGIVLIISLIGADGFTKVNVPLFAIQFIAIAFGAFSLFTRSPAQELGPLKMDYDGWSLKTLRENSWFDFSGTCTEDVPMCSFQVVFGITFPAATGIMEGANLSGDLKNPQKSIWKGTLSAIAASWLCYMIVVLAFAGSVNRDQLKNTLESMYTVAYWPDGITVGAVISTLSSALGAVFGGSRLLQAVARDNLFPGLHYVGAGSGPHDEPRRAVLVTWAIAQSCLFLGGLTVIAPIISSFFCLSYGLTNFACFLLSVSGTPNFRPRFRYFSWHTALLGFLINIGIMFYLNWIYAIVSLVCMCILSTYLIFRPNPSGDNWGDVWQAIIFHGVRKFLLRMDQRSHHGKLWRPSVLLLGCPAQSALAQLCNQMKKGGLYVIGDVLLDNPDGGEANGRVYRLIQRHALDSIEAAKIKAFPQLTQAPSMRVGCKSLAMTAGLGAMAPNTVVLEMVGQSHAQMRRSLGVGRSVRHRSVQDDIPVMDIDGEPLIGDELEAMSRIGVVRDSNEFVKILGDAMVLGKHVVVAANFEGLEGNDVRQWRSDRDGHTADIWLPAWMPIDSWEEFAHTSLLMVQLAWVIMLNKDKVRLFRELAPGVSAEDERNQLVELVKRRARFRIGPAGEGIHVISSFASPVDEDAGEERIVGDPESPITVDGWTALNRLVKEQCNNTGYVVLPMPPLPGSGPLAPQSGEEWAEWTRALVQDLPPTLLIQAGEGDIMSVGL